MVLLGLQPRLCPSIGGVIGNLSLAGLNSIDINAVNATYAPAIPEIFLRFPTKIRSNYTSINHRCLCRTNTFQIPANLCRFVVNPHLFPIAHWMWNADGWLHLLGAWDFAGGIVVHIAAGLSALAAALIVVDAKVAFTGKTNLKRLNGKLPVFLQWHRI